MLVAIVFGSAPICYCAARQLNTDAAERMTSLDTCGPFRIAICNSNRGVGDGLVV